VRVDVCRDLLQEDLCFCDAVTKRLNETSCRARRLATLRTGGLLRVHYFILFTRASANVIFSRSGTRALICGGRRSIVGDRCSPILDAVSRPRRHIFGNTSGVFQQYLGCLQTLSFAAR
jgi:hypothetical protein